MNYNALVDQYPHIDIHLNTPLSNYTYTKTGGPADVLAFPKNSQEVQDLLVWLKETQTPLTILGNASNLIVKDGGIRGLVLMLTSLTDITVKGSVVEVASGASLIETCQKARDEHLTGLEFACGIPGSVGGAIFMNAGAYGGEIQDVIESVDVITGDGEFKTYTNDACNFGYRQSVFQETGDVIVNAKFRLEPGDITAIQNKMDELTKMRQDRQPLEFPSCGSVFKRPEGYFAGKLIQDAGLQGYQIGGAKVSKKHAGFVINVDKATGADYIALIKHIQDAVWEKDGVRLEREVKIIGDDA